LKKSFLTEKEKALKKLQKYCAYQDRCHQEVRSKLLTLKIYGDDLENIMVQLIEENFLNEERFACSFARGKFRIKKWGRTRIQQELKKRKISAYCIKKAMQEIEEEDYLITLQKLIEKKLQQSKETHPFKKKAKLAKYLMNKGYESSLVWTELNRLMN